MKKLLATLAVAAVIAATAAGFIVYQRTRTLEQREAKRLGALADRFYDPGSVQWKDLHESKDGSICGLVNAKNRNSGYVGYQLFYTTREGAFEVVGEAPTVVQTSSPELIQNQIKAVQDYTSKVNHFGMHCPDIAK